MSYINKLLSVLLVSAFISMAAQADFYVIPVKAKMKNLVRVAKSGGDFNDPLKAMASIQGATGTNRYALYLEDDFNLTAPLHIKNYVDIYGNGHRLTGHFGTADADHPSAVVYGGNYSHLYNLTIYNESNNSQGYSVGLLNDAVDVTVTDVTIIAMNGDTDIGILNKNGASLDASVLRMELPACRSECFGISASRTSTVFLSKYNIQLFANNTTSRLSGISLNSLSSGSINGGEINIEGGGAAYGIETDDSSVSLTKSTVSATSHYNTYGIHVRQSMADISHAIIMAQSGTLINTAFYNEASTSTLLDNTLSGTTSVDSNLNSTNALIACTVDGGIIKDAAGTYNICAGTKDVNATTYFNRDCQ